MKKIALLILVFFANISISLNAQTINPDLRINIAATSIFRGNYLSVNILKHHNLLKITYLITDSGSYQMMLNNRKFNRVQNKSIALNKDSVDKLYRQIYGTGPKYIKDSLWINTNKYPLYVKLLNKVCSTNSDILENKQANKNRVILDGMHYYFDIKNGKTERLVKAQSPDQQSYPILYQLLLQTTGIINKLKSDHFSL